MCSHILENSKQQARILEVIGQCISYLRPSIWRVLSFFI